MAKAAKYGASVGKWIRNALGMRPRDAIEKTWINDDPTFGYRPNMQLQAETILDELPFFRLQTARLMLCDPVIRIGLTCRNAALSAGQIQVECKNAKAREWIGKQWQYLWNHHRTALLRAKIFGHAGLQLELKRNRENGTIDICGLKEFAPEDVRPLSYGGRVAAFRVRSSNGSPVLLPPRGVWLSFPDDAGQPGGSSILKRAYSPWWEKHMPAGAVKTRQLRLIKDAYIGDVLQFPYGESVDDENGNPIPWRDIVRSISEARLAGATIVIPRKMDAEGNDQITYTPPQDTGTPTGIYQWVDDLDRDMWRGLDVFEEVIQAADTGSGFSGRSIPLTMFLAGCGEELVQIVQCLDEFAFAPLVYWNFGPNVEYDITVVPLVKTFAQDMGGSPMGGEAMGGQASSRPPGRNPPGQQPPPPQQGQPARPQPLKPQAGPTKKPTQFAEPLEGYGAPTIDYDTSDAIASRTVAALRQAMTIHPGDLVREVRRQRTTSKRLKDDEALSAVLGAIPLIVVRKQRVAQEIAEDGLIMASIAGAAAAQATIEREAEIIQATAVEAVFPVTTPTTPAATPVVVPSLEEIPVPVVTPDVPPLEDRPLPVAPMPITQPEIPDPPKGRVPSTESLFGRRKRIRFPNEIRARKRLRDSVALAGQDYRETARMVKEDAFAITTRMGDDMVAHIRDELKKNMREGMDLKAFIEQVQKIQRGQEFPLSRARIELVFRANTARYLSDSADAALRNPLAADQFPYRAYAATHDDRVRDTHLRLEQTGLNGTNVYRYDDPAWKAFRPPWAYSCRCFWRPVSVRQAARIGVVEANNWLARATGMANAGGGIADQYLTRTRPPSGEFVPWPTVDGEEFRPSPEWTRTGVQFAESWGKFDVATPTDAQKEAGNYRKGHVTWKGLDIAIENPRGSVRKGDGWRTVMKSHYGYIKSTKGKDGDHVDVFLGPNPESEIVFIVNQTDKQGRFDEHKVMVGWHNQDDAKAGYLANYSAGWKCGPIVAMTIGQFKEWLENGNTTKPCCEQFAEIQRGLFGDDFDVESKPAKPQKKAKPESTERQGMLWTGLDLLPGQRDFFDEGGDKITKPTKKDDDTIEIRRGDSLDLDFESKHPRKPAGNEHGGEFAKKNEAINQKAQGEINASEENQTEGYDGRQLDTERDSSGSNSGIAGKDQREARGRILLQRSDLTRKADVARVPEEHRPHLNATQQQGVALALEAIDAHGGFLLADGTGVGKTRQILSVADAYAKQGRAVVVIAPSEVIKPDWKKGTAAGSYANDSVQMGINFDLQKGDIVPPSGKITLTTYTEIGKIQDHIDDNTIVIFDESHALKNSGSQRGKAGREIAFKAGGVLYASATPADKPLHIAHLLRAGVFGKGSQSARKFFGKSEDTYRELGLIKRDIRTRNGTVSKWVINPQVGHAEVSRRLSGLFDQMTSDGLMVQRSMSLDNVNVEVNHIQMPPEAKEAIEAAYDRAVEEHPDNAAVAVMAMRRAQEPHKIPATVDLVHDALKEGRSPIIFLNRVNDNIPDDDEDSESDSDSNDDLVDENTARLLRESLIASGIDASEIGELHGAAAKTPEAKRKAMKAFNDGKTKILISTIQSGGTGVNLDDTTGNRPRTILMMTPPFSANDVVQAAGRINRLSTKSDAKIVNLVSDHSVDQWNISILTKKLATLGAATKGTIPDDKEDDLKEPYKWPKSLVGDRPGDKKELSGKETKSQYTQVPTKKVNTRNGERHIYSFSPTGAFWDARKAGKLDKTVGVGKNPRNGEWEATIWGTSPEETARIFDSLPKEFFHNQPVQFRENSQSGWITLGGGASVFVGNGRIIHGCPGLKGEDVEDLIDEPDASRERRERRQKKAEALGLDGEDLSADDLEALEDGEIPQGGDAFDFGANTDPEPEKADPVEVYITQASEFALGLGYGPEVLGINRESVTVAMHEGTPPEVFAQQRIDDWMAQFQPGFKPEATDRNIRKGTKLYKQIREAVTSQYGDASEDDVQYFGAVLLDVLKQRQSEAIDWNQTRRDMLWEMGLSDGMAAARIAKEIRAGKDPSQINRFDEIAKVIHGERGDRYRALFRATQSESEGKDDVDSMLMDLLSSTAKKVPSLHDDEIWADAWSAVSYALNRDKTYDPDEEYWKSVEFSEPTRHWALPYWDWRDEYFSVPGNH